MDVLEPAWRGMEGRMRKASDLDQVCGLDGPAGVNVGEGCSCHGHTC
jgi:hypothetical protein